MLTQYRARLIEALKKEKSASNRILKRAAVLHMEWRKIEQQLLISQRNAQFLAERLAVVEKHDSGEPIAHPKGKHLK